MASLTQHGNSSDIVEKAEVMPAQTDCGNLETMTRWMLMCLISNCLYRVCERVCVSGLMAAVIALHLVQTPAGHAPSSYSPLRDSSSA